MKRLNLSIILSLFCIVQIFAQKEYLTQYEVQYDLTYSPDTLHLDNKNEETDYLYTGADYGVFMGENKANANKMKMAFQKQLRSGGGTLNFESKPYTFDKVFYKNLQTGGVSTVGNIAGKEFEFTEPKMPLNWKVKDSTKEIMGYTVQKATTNFAGRDYVAWFTLSVPIHDGPYLFSGLPGLIVEVYDTQNHYHFKLKSLKRLDEPKTWTVSDMDTISKTKFKKLKAKAAKNASSDLENLLGGNDSPSPSGVTISIEFSKDGRKLSKAEARRLMRKSKKRRNNPIELK